MNEIKDRIREVRVDKKLSHWDFSLKISDREGRVKAVEYGRQKVPADMTRMIVQIFRVNAHWLLTGEGEMYQPHSDAMPISVQEKLIKNHRQSKITAFVEHWFAAKSMDEQAWFEVQLGHSFPQYQDFISNKVMKGKL